MEKKRIVFIVNPISGTNNKDKLPALIETGIDKEQFDCTIRWTEYAGHAAEITRECVADGIDVVVAVGGDGTVNEVARSLTHSSTALAIIPSGSGNGLARHLSLPMDTKRAIAVINACHIRKFDYGVIDGRPFFCTCGMGFDAFISQKFAEAGKRGFITYTENVLKEGLKYKPEVYEVSDETGTKKFKAFLIACANASQYGNNAYIAPNATMTDGLMDVIVMEPFDAFDAPQIAIDMMNRTLNRNSKIKTFQAKKIHIHRTSAGAIHFDGDPVLAGTDIDIHIEAQGISIVANPDTPEDATPPNVVLNVFSDLFANINNVREDIGRRGHRLRVLQRLWLRRLDMQAQAIASHAQAIATDATNAIKDLTPLK